MKLEAKTLRCENLEGDQDHKEIFMKKVNIVTKKPRENIGRHRHPPVFTAWHFAQYHSLNSTGDIKERHPTKQSAKKPKPRICETNTGFICKRDGGLWHGNDTQLARRIWSWSKYIECLHGISDAATIIEQYFTLGINYISIDRLNSCSLCFNRWHKVLDCLLAYR